MTRRIAPVSWLLTAIVSAAAGFLLVAGGNQAKAQTFGIGGHRTKGVIVFMDETGSDLGDWKAMREQAGRIASRLGSTATRLP